MRWAYFIAAALALLSAALHFFVIGPDIFDPIMLAATDMKQRALLGVIWNGVGLMLVCATLVLIWAAIVGNPRARPGGVIAGLLLLGLGALYLSAGIRWLDDPLAMPYWTVVLPAGLFALLAAF